MNFSQFVVLILICYGIYYSTVLGIDFFSNNGKATAAVLGHSAHGVSFELKQQPVVVADLKNGMMPSQLQDHSENPFVNEQAMPVAKKNNSTIVADLGLEILSNGIDISAENLAILLS